MGLTALLALGCAGCGSANPLEPHEAGAVFFYTRRVETGSPIAVPVDYSGSFTVEDGCVVVHFAGGDVPRASPVFMPDGNLNEDNTAITAGDTTFPLDGREMRFRGELLGRKQVRDLGYDEEDRCPLARFAFVYG